MPRFLSLLAITVLAASSASAETRFSYFKQSSNPACDSPLATAFGALCTSVPVYGVMIQGRSDSSTAVAIRYTVTYALPGDEENELTTSQTVKLFRADMPTYTGCWAADDNLPCNAPAMWFFTPRRDFVVLRITAEEIQPLTPTSKKPIPEGTINRSRR